MSKNPLKPSQTKILPQAKLESLCFKSAPNQERLFDYLCQHREASTIHLRSNLSIGNVSDTVAIINDKLAASDDPRTIICVLKPHVNKFGKTGIIGWYLIVNAASNDSSM